MSRDGVSLSVSESGNKQSLEDLRSSVVGGDSLSLAALRTSLTQSGASTLDDATHRSARFREEERLRSRLRRDRRLRLKAQSERIAAMQDNISSELETRHTMTIEQLERELRQEMDEELQQLEQDCTTSRHRFF